MNFEEILKKVQDGTATPEEREFVKARLSEANEVLSKAEQPAIVFDEALQRVREGTATEEEREYVKAQLDLANAALSKNDGPVGTVEPDKPVEPDKSVEPVAQKEERKIDFEEALRHTQEGTATEEEKLYVNAQLAEAWASISNEARMPSPPVKEASKDDVKKAKKSFKLRYIVIPVCVIVSIIVVIGAVLSGVFGYAASSAKKNIKYDKNACEAAAREYAVTHQIELFNLDESYFDASQFTVREADRHFMYNDSSLSNSYYSYEIELKARKFVSSGRHGVLEVEVEFNVDTRTGQATVVKYDVEWD